MKKSIEEKAATCLRKNPPEVGDTFGRHPTIGLSVLSGDYNTFG
jgi:hypothetical protein